MTNNLDDLAKRLKTLSDNAKAINGENEVPLMNCLASLSCFNTRITLTHHLTVF